jgi:probable phosphomutase (TIGR03848 family)
MTTFLLIRHGDNDAIGRTMAGWTPGWHLNARGKQQAERLAQRLAGRPIRAIYTSPLERTVETAEAIARLHGLKPQHVDALGEIRLGEWEGRPIAELDRREDWRKFNTFRSGTRAPGGELMIETQTRMVQQIAWLCERHPDDTIAVVSHADPLRALIAYFLGMPLDLVVRLEIGPASLSVLQVHGWGARVLSLNEMEGQ